MDKKVNKYSRENGNMNIVPTNNQEKKPNLSIGTLNVFTKEHKVLGRSRKMRWFSDSALIVIIAIILFLGVSYTIRTYSIGKNILLETRALSQRVSSGNLETFELDYKNTNKESIYGATISLELPDNFTLEEVLPKEAFNENTNTFDLGDLASGANGKIKISGFVLGEVGSQQLIKFSLNYSKDALNRSCSSVLFYLIEDSVLDLKLSMPKNLYQEVLFSSQLTLHNQGQRDLENIRVVFDKNIELYKVDIFQGLNFDLNSIYLNNLKKNEKITLNLDLLVKNYQGQVNLETISEANGLKQKSLKSEIFVEVPKFRLDISSDQKQMKEGEYLDFKINYQNNENNPIENISLDLNSLTDFSIKDLQLIDNTGFRKEGYTIYFNESLAVQERGSFDIKILLNRHKAKINQEVGFLANINYTHQGKNISYPSYSSRVKLLSNIDVKSAGYYYSPQGDQLGMGPIPPVFDIPTNYWIFWEVDNFGNDLSTFSLSAELPESLVWTNNKSILAGNLHYGEASRRITWNLDEVSAQGNTYKARFEVSLIPDEGDIGKVLNLLENIEFSVNDNFCGVQILGAKENIDTNLKDDNLISGEGKIQPLEY
jgi:hypothetical protein